MKLAATKLATCLLYSAICASAVLWYSPGADAASAWPPPPTSRSTGPGYVQPAAPAQPAATYPLPSANNYPAQPSAYTVDILNAAATPVDAYLVDQTGNPTYLSTIPTGGDQPYQLDPGQELIFGVNGEQVASYVMTDQPGQSFTVGNAQSGMQPGMAQPPSPTAPAFPAQGYAPQQPQPVAPNDQMQPSQAYQPRTARPNTAYPGFQSPPDVVPAQQPAANSGPSFDCRQASLPAEQTICGDPELAQWDEKMAKAYAWVMSQLPANRQNELVQDQSAWLSKRNQCGTSVDCLMSGYLDRVAYLNEYFADDAGPGAGQEPAATFPIEARSWGGKVRSGPGPNFAQVGSLQEREPITLLEQSDAPLFQNFPWFKIRFHGRVGYQWGGIICGTDAPIPGAFETCK